MLLKTIRNMSKKQKLAAAGILAPPIFALFVYIAGKVVMGLWNWLLPPLFGFPEVTFWQGLGLVLLGRILFGGWGGGGSHSSNSMSPEQRERFREAANRRLEGGGSAEPSC